MRFYNNYDLCSSHHVMEIWKHQLIAIYLNTDFILPITQQPMRLLHINLILLLFSSQEVSVAALFSHLFTNFVLMSISKLSSLFGWWPFANLVPARESQLNHPIEENLFVSTLSLQINQKCKEMDVYAR